MIKPYLRDMINDHETPKSLKVHLSHKVFDYKTQFEEWQIQLTMPINYISSKNDFDDL